jgi:hypothetical protein
VLRHILLCLFVMGLLAGCSTPSTGGSEPSKLDPVTSEPETPTIDPAAIVDLAAGGGHACAVLGSGHVACWGTNDKWQLGDGTQESTQTPVMVNGLSDAVALTVGAAHTCALRANGTVWCWGNEENGRLGNGNLRHKDAGEKFPALVRAVSAGEDACHRRGPLKGVQAIAAGNAFTCALLESQSVVCWGALESTEWVTGRDSSPCPVPIYDLHDAKQIAAGSSHACALREDGKVACFGGSFVFASTMGIRPTTPDRDHRYAKPGNVDGLPEATFVAAGRMQTCAVTADERVFCWGTNDSPVLVEGGPKKLSEPVEVPELAGAKELAIASGRICGWGGSFGATIRCLGPPLAPPEPTKLTGEVADATDSASAPSTNNTTSKPTSELDETPRVHELDLGAEPSQVSFAWKFGCARMGSVDIMCWGQTPGDQPDSPNQPHPPQKAALDAPALVEEASARPPFERPGIGVEELDIDRCDIDMTLGEGPSTLRFDHGGRTLGVNFDGVTAAYNDQRESLQVKFPPAYVSETSVDKKPQHIAPSFYVKDFSGGAGTYRVSVNPQSMPDHLGCFPLTWYVPGEIEISSFDQATGELDATFHFGPRGGPFGTLSGTLSTQPTTKIELASRDASNQVSVGSEDLDASAVSYDPARRKLSVYYPGRRDDMAVRTYFGDFPQQVGKYLLTRHFGDISLRDFDQGLPEKVSSEVYFYDLERLDSERVTATIWSIDERDLPQRYDPDSLSFFGKLHVPLTEAFIREHGELKAKINTEAVFFSPGKRQELSLDPATTGSSSAPRALSDAVRDAGLEVGLEVGKHSRIFYAGKKVDAFLKEQGLPMAKWEWKVDTDAVDETEALRVEANFSRRAVFHLRADTLTPLRWQKTNRIYYDDHFGGPQDTELTVTFAGDKLEMHAKNSVQGEHSATYALPEEVYLEHQLFWLIPRLDLSKDSAFSLKLFRIEEEDLSMKSTAQWMALSPEMSDEARKELREKYKYKMKRYVYRPAFVDATLRVLGEETVEIGERSAEAYRVELAGEDRRRRTFLVQKKAPHVVLVEEPSPDQTPGFRLRDTVLLDSGWAPKYADGGSNSIEFAAQDLKATIGAKSVEVEPAHLQSVLEAMKNNELKKIAGLVIYPYLLPDRCRLVPDKKTFLKEQDKSKSRRRRDRGPSPYLSHLIDMQFVTDVNSIDEGPRKIIERWEELSTDCDDLDSSTKQALSKRKSVYLTLELMMNGKRNNMLVQLSEDGGAWKVSGISAYR